MRLLSLHLQNFRNFEGLSLETLSPVVALVGPNGAGKTNILEAVSLLTPGRGLRNAALPQILRQGADPAIGWGVKSETQDRLAISTGWRHGMARRALSLGADDKAKQKDLGDTITAHWLTPAMDRLLAEAPAGRRRFIDRLVFALDPAHAGRVTRYEKTVAERLKILKEGRAQSDWLSGLEMDAAHTGASIAAARVAWFNRITPYLTSATMDKFPQPAIKLHGFLEMGLRDQQSSLTLERRLADALANARKTDAENGSCSAGPHRTDVEITYAQKGQDARLASTGEQKALLISLILAQTKMLQEERGMQPLLLLDDISSHLDEQRRASLFATLSSYAHEGGQVFVTGADPAALSSLKADTLLDISTLAP